MRDLALAQALGRRGSKVEFACRPARGDAIGVLESAGFRVHRLLGNSAGEASDAAEVALLLDRSRINCSWLVVDHYGLGSQWESNLRSRVGRILVIDDLANRAHDCDVLLDQNLYSDMERRYDGLVPPYCKRLLGPGYALLREEFRRMRPAVRPRKSIRHMLLSMGGADAGNATSKALAAVSLLGAAALVTDVVVGWANPHVAQVKAQCETLPNTYFHQAVENMAELVAAADIAISAGGISLWERCYLGLPSVSIAIASNQIETVRCGAGIFRGSESDVLERYYQAATEASADVVVRVTSDCPLFDGQLLTKMLERFQEKMPDGIIDYLSNSLKRTFPRGLDAEVFTFAALKCAYENATTPAEREHVTPYLYRHPERYNLQNYSGDIDLSAHRWTLDTREDYEMISAVYENLYLPGVLISTSDVLEFLAGCPDVENLNINIEQKALGY
jgi:UDP-2,4-diacetamido-2,4,6-trideoxy-beta-L-altropyranose hydrolase